MAILSTSELFDLYETLCEKMGTDDLLSAMTLANRQGNLDAMLESMGFSHLCNDGVMKAKKILVLGASTVKDAKLRSIAIREGFDAEDFEFFTDYDRIKHFNFGKLKYSENYAAVFIGPQPHSTTGKADAGSAVAEMERRPEAFPPIVRLTDSNELKITVSSFRAALQKIQRLL